MDVIRLETARSQAGTEKEKIEGSRILPRPEILPGLDALRAFAAIAVVLLHSSVPYLKHPMPGLIWPITEGGSGMIDVAFWGTEVFIMPVFLVMTGFLLHRSSNRLPPRELFVSRAKRLLLPLLVAALVILPLDLFIWTLGLITQGLVKATKLRNYSFDGPIREQIWGLSHLWFLLYLFLYSGCAVVALMLRRRIQRNVPVVNRLGRRGLVLILGAIAVATVSISPEVVWGFQHAFLPVPSKWLYCGCFFAAGWLLSSWDPGLVWADQFGNRMLALGLTLLAGSVTLGIWLLEQQQADRASSHFANVVLGILTTSSATAITLGLFGVCVNRIRHIPNPIRYVAAASFWIYIVHQPIVGVVHLDLYQSWPAGPALVKLGTSFAIGTVLSLLLFEAFVRNGRLSGLFGYKHLGPRSFNETSAIATEFRTDKADYHRAA